MILHTVNKSSDCLVRCLSMTSEGDAILLIEDGVYAAMNNSRNEALWHDDHAGFTRYALESDLAARGISDKMLPGIEVINWQQFVSLATTCDKVVSWG